MSWFRSALSQEYNARAMTTSNVALGSMSGHTFTGSGNISIGSYSGLSSLESVGARYSLGMPCDRLEGEGNVCVGSSITGIGINNFVVGKNIYVEGDDNMIKGKDVRVVGSNNFVIGTRVWFRGSGQVYIKTDVIKKVRKALSKVICRDLAGMVVDFL